MSHVALSGVSKRYNGRDTLAVDALSFTVEQGEILALLGPSGCGKTTTLRLIAGFEAPDAGRITIAQRTVAEAGPGGAASLGPEARRVGLVFQDYALFPHLTVEENVAFGLRSLDRPARRARVAEVLGLVGLAGLASRYPHELSGGEQQRVAVARALAPTPTVMLLDEPFSNLDADLRARVREEVGMLLRTTRTTTIFVTHDQEEAFTVADRVGVLHRGRLEQLDIPETVYHRPATTFVAEFVGAADFLPGVVGTDGIVTEIGSVANQQGLAPGRRVKVMVRPDDITFDVATDGEAVIVRRYFRGSETLYGLRLPSGRHVSSSQASATAFAVGARVRVKLSPLHVVTFE